MSYLKRGDKVVCKDVSGPSILLVEAGKHYIVEKVLSDCYIKLKDISQLQKMWRFNKL